MDETLVYTRRPTKPTHSNYTIAQVLKYQILVRRLRYVHRAKTIRK
jgi:hypothetical protein